MKLGFYPRLALLGVSKNRRLYFPYILTTVGMVMMFYILASLSDCELLNHTAGGENVRMILALGKWVIAVFALIFLFYTSSFLMRRRRREFGLYNILGMDKRGIARVTACESILVAIAGLAFGLGLGIAFSKLAELGLLRTVRMETDYSLRFSSKAVLDTLGIFSVIFALLFVNSIFRVGSARPLELLKSENVGEKPPRGNFLFALIGALLLGGAYYLAVAITSPIDAIFYFFIAVIMVIVGTYLLMTAGSVTLCRMLQKNRGYYYKKEHFVPVASMTYRMKRNGAGLASICILSTMVLVMVSSSLSLYIGAEDSLRNRYPRDLNLNVMFANAEGLGDANIEALRNSVEKTVSSHGAKRSNIIDYRSFALGGICSGGELVIGDRGENSQPGEYVQAVFLPLSDYRALTGQEVTLDAGEALVAAPGTGFKGGSFKVGGLEFSVAGEAELFGAGDSSTDAVATVYIVLGDFMETAEMLGEDMILYPLRWSCDFDLDCGDETEQLIADEFPDAFEGIWERFWCDRQAANRADFYGTYGGLFFIGVILSIVFITAAVLMIYYKQLCEGFEDRPRFAIMQKLGMTDRDIRKSVNSQMLTVFAAPLVLAGAHMSFAFPFIWRMLKLFALNNLPLVAMVTLCAFAVFALFYAIVYRLTSNEYCRIVSGGM